MSLAEITAITSALVASIATLVELRWTRADRQAQKRSQAGNPVIHIPSGFRNKNVTVPEPKRRDLRPLILSASSVLLVALVLIGIGQLADDDKDDGGLLPSPIVDDFDRDAQGWATIYDTEEVRYLADGGNPGGYVSATDVLEKYTTWYWEAPFKYRGDKSAYVGRVLTFDLKQSLETEDFPAADVWLLGPNKLELVYDLAIKPGPDWASYRVPLDGGKGWQKVDYDRGVNVPATVEDMRAILSNLTYLRIRGEYANGRDVGGLDNVKFGV